MLRFLPLLELLGTQPAKARAISDCQIFAVCLFAAQALMRLVRLAALLAHQSAFMLLIHSKAIIIQLMTQAIPIRMFKLYLARLLRAALA
jgi:hypothetical protein